MSTRALVVVAGIAVVALPSASAQAKLKHGPCIPGTKAPVCAIWKGKVKPVDDGDTVNVDIRGDLTARKAKVRLTGVQAMELRSYSRYYGRTGECHAIEATERLEALIRKSKNRVRLAAINPTSITGHRGRLRRSLAVRHKRRWMDVGEVLIREGLALWFPNPTEWAWNRRYSRLAEAAARRGVGIWKSDACGVGPGGQNTLRLKVKWNADDDDSHNVGGEWVRITNTDPVNDVELGGWWFRDSHLRRYAFPSTAVVPPGGSITLHMGSGMNDADTFYWGLNEPVFENATNDERQIGDGGYLFDPQGDLRAAVQYPCRTACVEPLAGKVAVEAAYKAPEAIRVRNVSTEIINLAEYEIESVPWFYEFGTDAVLVPGQTFTLWVGNSFLPDTPFARSWGKSVYLLADKKDVVTLRNPRGAPVACDAWGGLQCPSV
jgi:endonuclease YncB( thermonuclease family)